MQQELHINRLEFGFGKDRFSFIVSVGFHLVCDTPFKMG